MSNKPASFPAHYSATSKYIGLIFILIIAIPIGIALYFSIEGPLFLTVFMFGLLLGIIALLSYFVFAGGKTHYELTPEALRINIVLFRKTINYKKISTAEIQNLSISLRIFGASLPGINWGLFRTSIGNLHVYATKIDGQFVILTLANGEKIALSPQNPQDLLEALEQQRHLFGQENIQVTEKQEKANKKLVYLQVIAVSAVYIATLGYFFSVYLSLPQIVPLHFGFDGVPNRFGDKSELLWLTGTLAALPIINAALTLKFGKHERAFVILLGIIFIAVNVVFLYSIQSIAAIG